MDDMNSQDDDGNQSENQEIKKSYDKRVFVATRNGVDYHFHKLEPENEYIKHEDFDVKNEDKVDVLYLKELPTTFSGFSEIDLANLKKINVENVSLYLVPDDGKTYIKILKDNYIPIDKLPVRKLKQTDVKSVNNNIYTGIGLVSLIIVFLLLVIVFENLYPGTFKNA